MATMRETIQVPHETAERLRALASERQQTLGEAVTYLVQLEEERRFWQEFNAGYDALRNDPEAWAEEQS